MHSKAQDKRFKMLNKTQSTKMKENERLCSNVNTLEN